LGIWGKINLNFLCYYNNVGEYIVNIWNNKQVLDITGKILEKEIKEEALCNEVYFVSAEKGKFIIKIAHGKIRQDELDKEFNIISQLKSKICLPKIYLYEKTEEYSYFIMKYIEGSKPKQFIDKVLKQMAESLKNIHQVNLTDSFVDYETILKLAEQNMIENRLDLDEFVKDGKTYEPKDVLVYLKENRPKAKACLLHGDYRPKNMLIEGDNLYILDWGLSFVGDPYYDIAIIKWYFTDEEFDKFVKYYGIENLDNQRLEYNEWLSAFLNV
jgi:aminoglycoside phosphotransferase (APT) family kinase protein